MLLIAAGLMMAILAGCTPTNMATHSTEDLQNGGWWQRYVVYWFAYALDTFADWFGGEYGLAVLVLVLIVRTLILPLTLKQVKSSKAMQAIQPQLQKLREEYKDDPQRQQAETMKLFQENQVNPAAGCLPLIIQMPVFIALYNAIIYNTGLREHTFLWLQLGEPDKWFILPVIAAITTFLQTKMMMSMNPAQMQGPMKIMMYMYPIIISSCLINSHQHFRCTGYTVIFTRSYRTISCIVTKIQWLLIWVQLQIQQVLLAKLLTTKLVTRKNRKRNVVKKFYWSAVPRGSVLTIDVTYYRSIVFTF